jgi:predicted porin
MKKLLIATAALAMVAGTVQAQSSVTVYGVMDIGVSESKFDAKNNAGATVDRKTSTTGNGDGGLATSRLGFQGSEDLGGGSKANFRLEYDLTDVGSGGQTLGARESWVSLSNDNGDLKLGRQATPSHGIIAAYSAGMANNTAGAIYSAGTGIQTTTNPNELSIRPHTVFANRMITYTSPNMNGLVLGVSYGKNSYDAEAANKTESSLTDLAAKYDAGKLSVGASKQRVKTRDNAFAVGAQTDATALGLAAAGGFGAGTEFAVQPASGAGQVTTDTTIIGASYNFGIVQPFALYTEKTVSGSTLAGAGTAINGDVYKQKASEIGLRAPVGKMTTVFASMYDGDIKTGANLATKDNVKGYQLGAIYSLSKRTAAYVISGEQQLDGTAANTYSMKVKNTTAGVRHSF